MSLTEHDGLRICDRCREGYHDDCSDYALWDGHDISGLPGATMGDKWEFLADGPWCDCDHDSRGTLVDWQSPRTALPAAAPLLVTGDVER